ncbi:MAG: hypothetical protein HS104_40930 [Polyangiaceae bacterium]|nr:hypothetical protein [Polyangiaceae bacterium]MCL4753911.1 hypothetical protein [Myxococcales bacterium]
MARRLGLAMPLFVALACAGSSDEEPVPSTEAMITDLCRKVASAKCDTVEDEQACAEELQEDQSRATQEGCRTQLDAYLSCAVSKPIGCTSYDGPSFPTVDESCGELRVAFGECWTKLSGMCAVGVGSGSPEVVTCTIKCPQLSSTCQGPDPNGPVDCACDMGPKAGTTFKATDCSLNLMWATGHTCQ